jgi:hypothetical protein
MKKFNKNKALNKLNKNRNKYDMKIKIIALSIMVLVGTIMYFSYARFELTNTYSLINGTVNIIKVRLVDKIIESKNSESSGLEYDGVQTLGTNGTNDNNLRYIGMNPKNYVYFNCSTENTKNMNSSTCEKWRIIGLFNDIEDEAGNVTSRVKIMREQSLGNYSWDTSDLSANEGSGINQWGASGSYEGADLMRELNTDYLGKITVGTDSKWYAGYSNLKSAQKPSTTLNEYSQGMIDSVVWNTGSYGMMDDNQTPIRLYNHERSTTSSKQCQEADYCNDNVIRTSTWTGKVALPYASDFGFSTSGGNIGRDNCLNIDFTHWTVISKKDYKDCSKDSWMSNQSQWLLTTYATLSDAYGVYSIFESLPSNEEAPMERGTYPTVFLKTNVTVTGGEGTSSNPYKLVID